MTSRVTQSAVRFSQPFRLPGLEGPQPAGEYRVDHEDEQIESATRIAWHRIRSFVFLPGIGMAGTTFQMVPVSPAELDAALAHGQGVAS